MEFNRSITRSLIITQKSFFLILSLETTSTTTFNIFVDDIRTKLLSFYSISLISDFILNSKKIL